VAAGIRYAGRLVRKNKIEMVHARAHIPAVIALALKRRFGVKIIFDVRGLMAEEYVDANHWKANGVPARLTKSMEARVLRATDGVVTLTDALWAEMQTWPSVSARPFIHETIPCCIDLDRFGFDPKGRTIRRAELGIQDRFVLVYSGSIGGWYLTDEMGGFFSVLRQKIPAAFFLWLTQGKSKIVSEAMARHGIAADHYAVKKASSVDVPSFLSAADAGIAFYRPGISRLGTSPVKVSEYLATGLPVIMNAAIGDTDRLIREYNVGTLVQDFNEAEYAKAAILLLQLVADSDRIRQSARQVAETLFDLRRAGIEGYARLYEGVLDGVG
jgi:glycosyltransferase involved in cell wall biosynthesis